MKFTKAEIESFNKENKNTDIKKKQYFHEDYPSFSRIELSTINFGWIFYGMLNYFWIKAIGSLAILILIWCILKLKFKNKSFQSEFTREERAYLLKRIRFLVKAMRLSMGIFVDEKNVEHNREVVNVYRKYLGENYNPEENADKYTTLISNHISWSDVLYMLSYESPSFIAKASVKKLPLVGYLAHLFKTLYIDRTNKNSRVEILNQIEERQKSIANGTSFFPLCIYPEGTTSNGRSIITFKKGAFYTLTPVKPVILKVDNNSGSFPLAAGGMSIPIHMIITLTFLKCNLTVLQLPVFSPNEYLFENYKHFGKDKAEIFAEACRHVMSEIGGLPLSDSSFETKLKYISEMKRKLIKNT